MASWCGRLKGIGDRTGTAYRYPNNNESGPYSVQSFEVSLGLVIVFGTGSMSDLRVEDEIHSDVTVVNQTLASQIAQAPVGEQVCFFYYKHLQRRPRLVGYRSASGKSASMPFAGLLLGLVWYLALYPIGYGLLFGFGGMLLGAVAGRQGSAAGLMLGVLAGVGICWLTAFQFVKAYGEARDRHSL